MKNQKIIYIIAVIIIIMGIVATYIWKTNFSLEYSEHTRIDLYLGKEYNLEDIKQIANEVFGDTTVEYQKIENFNDSIAINVKQVNDEQLTILKEKVKEKYEIDKVEEAVKSTLIPHYRLLDIVKPYIIPVIIATLIILAYVGIRYMKLGIFKVILTLAINLGLSEATLVSIIEISRIPVGSYFMPAILVVYILVTILTTAKYEKSLILKKQQESKKK